MLSLADRHIETAARAAVVLAAWLWAIAASAQERVRRWDWRKKDSVWVDITRFDIDERLYFGDMVASGTWGEPVRIYNEAGYIDIADNDSVSYHFYERDRLGSVHAIVAEDGTLEQHTDYHSGGLPSSRRPLAAVDNRLHTAKEFQNFRGIALYDNLARLYDPLTTRFTTVDPLAERTPWLSPYAHCANNPLRFIDPTGNYYLENMPYDNMTYSVIAVFPTVRDKTLDFDYITAKNNRVPIIIVDDIEDFRDAMSALYKFADSYTNSYVINSHGSPGEFKIGDDLISSNTNLSSLAEGLSHKIVFISACKTGLGDDGQQLTEHMSKTTNSTIITSLHNIRAGYKYDGGWGLTLDPISNLLRGNYTNDYIVSTNGSMAKIIFDLSIDKIEGFHWSSIGTKSVFKR